MTSKPQTASADVGDFYDRVTDLYTELWDGNLHVGYWHDGNDDATFEVATEQLTEQLVRRLAPESGWRVLDVGCGVGKPALSLARAYAVRVVGISNSRHQVDRATARADVAGLADRVEFVHTDAAELPFPEASFDAAWAIESLLHMPDKLKVLREVARVLRPGARFVLADMFHQAPGDLSDQPLVNTIGMGDYEGLLEQVKLSLVELTDITANTVIPRHARKMLVAKMVERREEYVRIIGQDTYDRMADPDAEIFSQPGFGYLLLTACRR